MQSFYVAFLLNKVLTINIYSTSGEICKLLTIIRKTKVNSESDKLELLSIASFLNYKIKIALSPPRLLWELNEKLFHKVHF